jgi:LacI family transcriptional regulator
MGKLGLPVNADLQVEAADFTYHAGLEAVEVLLDQASPDAIICANDLLAVAAMKVITSRGLTVPGDIALVGMDDTDVAQLTTPSITSVNLGSAKRARKAAKLLLSRLENRDLPPRVVVVEPKLTVRESSGAPL